MMVNKRKKPLIFCLVTFIGVMAGACSLKLQKFDIETPAQILATVDSPPVMDGRSRFWGQPAVMPEFTEFPKDILLEALVLFAIEQLQNAHR